jgi:aerobic-type carbon monoxide dehydrogenase small subunit (CoxS/CutS family)
LAKHLVKLNVNGKDHALVVESTERLLDVLRDQLNLRGVKEGCGTGDCGACTVIMDGHLVNSCLVLAVQAREKKITTIEGLGARERLHPIQKAFMKYNAAQCGFCTPAMVLAGKNLLDHNPTPSREEIRESISGVLCRCTGYYKIIDAIHDAAKQISEAKS